ncbi:transposable element Tcb2 transposase [Trichonephila clavipes]|nr:transposable element Tcb2 transposase [Trichonephila clavipes]
MPLTASCREDHHIVRNASVQPNVSSAAIQAQVAPSLRPPVSSQTIRMLLDEGLLGSGVHYVDKSRFNLSSDANRVRVWRTRRERLNPVFALQQRTAPTADNAWPHTTRVLKDCLRTVTTLPSPAQSPDLSPIEHIWDHLGWRVGHPTSLNELQAMLQQGWNEMSQDIIQK